MKHAPKSADSVKTPTGISHHTRIRTNWLNVATIVLASVAFGFFVYGILVLSEPF